MTYDSNSGVFYPKRLLAVPQTQDIEALQGRRLPAFHVQTHEY
jgi:hypothetical protein